MKKNLIIILVIFFAGCAGVSKKETKNIIKGKIAIAPFEHPTLSHDVLSGYIVKDSGKIDRDVLKKLTNILLSRVSARQGIEIIGPNFVNQCKELVVLKENKTYLNPVEKWIEIGKCIPSDYLIVPQLFIFKPRVGGKWGAYEPAKVMLSLNLIDITQGRLIRSYLYNEKQKPLSEDILEINKFIKRGGKWVSAYELAEEGIIQGIKELGL
ncbi:hypothetical protein [Desulfothermus sp.]